MAASLWREAKPDEVPRTGGGGGCLAGQKRRAIGRSSICPMTAFSSARPRHPEHHRSEHSRHRTEPRLPERRADLPCGTDRYRDELLRRRIVLLRTRRISRPYERCRRFAGLFSLFSARQRPDLEFRRFLEGKRTDHLGHVRYAELTGDKAWLARRWKKIEGMVGFIEELRRRTKQNPNALNFGLIPDGFGDGGTEAMREYSQCPLEHGGASRCDCRGEDAG